ncbi:HtaA domain-containing protein [Streptomyces sp. NPDC057115]|uniref:HtaA domain-containing protein n=1 Tax=unclassified Streptomyces TaxID=2593676 RepID=UPI00363BB1F5
MPARRRRSTALAAAVATATALGATALMGAPAASAAEVPLTGYELTWGIKDSYRTYVTGMAKGTFTPAGGAVQADGNGAFTFKEGTGSYDSTGHTVSLGFRGSLRIVSEAHRFDLTLSDIRFDSGDAEITADVTRDGTTTDDVPLAKVTVTRGMKDMATELTKEAGEVLGSASYEGAAGDPLTVLQTTKPSPTPDPEPTDEPTGEPTAQPTGKPSEKPTDKPTDHPAGKPATPGEPAAPATRGQIADGTLGWGVKDSFRAYVMGPVAKGRVTVSAGAKQAAGNGAFTFPDASGTYDTEAGSLTAAFKGAVNFKGHESDGTHGLDLTLTDLRATLKGGSGTLTADVTSLGTTSQDVVLAELKAKSPRLTAKSDVITVNGIAATLTKAGATAFGDFYTAGTALDPVGLSVALKDGAALPGGSGSGGGTAGSGTAGSGAGSAGGPGPSGSTTGGLGATGDLTGSLASTGSDVPAAALGTAAAVAVAAGAGVVLAVRRRRPAAE